LQDATTFSVGSTLEIWNRSTAIQTVRAFNNDVICTLAAHSAGVVDGATVKLTLIDPTVGITGAAWAASTRGVTPVVMDSGATPTYRTAGGGIWYGLNTKANTSSTGVGIGNSAVASNTNSIAVGTSASAAGTSSVAVGLSANASNTNSIAIGNGASATNTNSVAVGPSSTVAGDQACAFGIGASASGPSCTAAGSGAAASVLNTIALGRLSTANQSGAIGIGFSSSATAAAAIAVGASSVAAFADTIAIGRTATVLSAAYPLALAVTTTSLKADALGYSVNTAPAVLQRNTALGQVYASAGGATTLTGVGPGNFIITGSTATTINVQNATTFSVGSTLDIWNMSTASQTIRGPDNVTICTLAAHNAGVTNGEAVKLVLLDPTVGGTAAAWIYRKYATTI